jgi:hypothetical protein
MGKKDKPHVAGAIGGALLGGAVAGPPGAFVGGLIGLFVADSIDQKKSKAKKSTIKKTRHMANQKVIFVAFAIEDERQRDFLKGQSLNTACPIEFIDMSVKEAYASDWKEKVRTRIRRSHGVIALLSKNSVSSTGQQWEISCAKEEKKPLLGVWAYTDDRTTLSGVNTVVWTWDAITNFINSL